MNTGLSYSFSKILLGFFCCWLLASALQAHVLHQFGLTWEISIKDGLVSNGLLSLVGLLTLNIYRFYQPGKSNRIYRFALGLAIAVFYIFILKYLLIYVIPNNADYLLFLQKSIYLRFIFAFLLIGFITLANWIQNNSNEQKEKEKKQADVEALLREAELSKLRQQLQPHFLFNSLNSINALIGTKPYEARQMVQQLSDFLRGTLKKDEQKVVPLKEEFEQLKLYLEIEKVRFGHRLKVEMNITEQSQSFLIPPLLLQPIVENAIKFGLYDTIGEIMITVISKTEPGYLIVEVQNPYDGSTQSANKGTGFGLSSIKRRLYLLYARNDLMTTHKTETVFTTTLKIPQSA
ncbi:MAG TPA: histidine kinase [Bacteroidia bacterium]|nr:histidine kinase [Bacteroidia bacterium]